ncbi:hypothetical protein Tco_0585788 [Tanacetum coccineum]
MVIQRKQAANVSTHTPEPSRHFNLTCDDDDDDEENSIPLEDMPQISPSIALVPVSSIMEPEDSLIEVTYDKEQCLRDQYTLLSHSPCIQTNPYVLSYNGAIGHTLLMGDEVISTIPAKETNEFIKSSVDDFVPIPRDSEVTSDSVLECDMSATTPLPPTNNGKVYFDINSPLGEQVVDFLMENEDVAGLPRHLVKYLFNHLLKNPSLTKGMSDEPLGDDTISSDLVM